MSIDAGSSALGVRWQILGPLVGTRDGTALELGPRRQRAMLSLLLSRAGDKVSPSMLVDMLWGQAPPPTAVNVVHRYVGMLRRAVEPELGRRAQGGWLLSDAGDYRVVVNEDSLDLLRFRALTRRARALPAGAARLDLQVQALSLWRGPVAADVAVEMAVDTTLTAITREFVVAAVAAAEEALAVGRADRVLPALELARELDPTDETTQAVWMRCLSSCGQRAAALRGFEELRARLVEELGVSPGPDVQAAHLAVLRDDVALTVRGHALPTPRQLPAPVADFIGRQSLADLLINALSRSSDAPAVCVVTGTAGSGKTTLAVQVAHAIADQFPDGQLYVDLRGFDPTEAPLSPRDVLGRFLVALDVSPDRLPATVEERASLFRSALAGRRVLVVLDNARDTAQVRDLLPGTGPVSTVVTSRHQLRGLTAAGTQPVAVGLFDHGEAEQFLRSRLGDRRVEEDLGAARALIERSGRLPIGLSLLSARVAHSPDVTLREIVDALSSAGPLDHFVDRADPRTNARAVISWSYRSLTAAAAHLFTLTAVHPGQTFTTEQLVDLVGLEAAVVRSQIDELVEANLLTLLPGGRLWHHDLLRHYAAELINEWKTTGRAVAREEAEDRLYDHMVTYALAASTVLDPGRAPLTVTADSPRGSASVTRRVADAPRFSTTAEATAWLDNEHLTILALVARAGLTRPEDLRTPQLAWALDWYLDNGGLWAESLAAYQAGMSAAARIDDLPLQVAMRRGMAVARSGLGQFVEAAAEIRAAVELLEARPDSPAQLRAATYRYLSWALEFVDDLPGALAASRRALTILEEAGPLDSSDLSRAHALNAVGYCEAQVGLLDEALEHCYAALALFRDATHQRGLAHTWGSVGLVHYRRGELQQAIHGYRCALQLFRSMRNRRGEADASLDRGRVLHRAGHSDPARSLLHDAVRIYEELDQGPEARAAAEALQELEGLAAPAT